MSQENVEVVRGVFEAWNAGDMDAIRNACDPEIIMQRGFPAPSLGALLLLRESSSLGDGLTKDARG